MRDTSARLLALLSLLQSRPDWRGAEIADRLGVTTRTVRKDVARLRALGYPVDAAVGPAGHYRLGAGAKLPPLLLDDEEAVAVAVGLRSATGIGGIEQSSVRALRKLEQVLPARLRRGVAAIGESTSRAPEDTDTNVADPAVDPAVLATVAAAIRDHEGLRLDPGDTAGPGPVVEPHRLVHWQRRWYVVAFDRGPARWRALRVDGMRLRTPNGPRFPARVLPAAPGGHGQDDYVGFVLRDVASTEWAVHARILVHAPADDVIARINPAVGVVESVDDATSVLVTGADSPEMIAVYIGLLGLDFEVTGPDALVEHLRVLGRRYLRAVPSDGAGTGRVRTVT